MFITYQIIVFSCRFLRNRKSLNEFFVKTKKIIIYIHKKSYDYVKFNNIT